jgi:ATP-binding cassette, subfamily C (CFTR/MRP), member 1
LSFLEHGRSVKPSTLITFYLVASIICDSINLATVYERQAETRILALLTASSGLKVILLVLETLNKRSYLREPYKILPLEETVSDLNRIFLFWMNGQIWKGHKKLLSVADLPELDEHMKSIGLRATAVQVWEKSGGS